MRPRSPMRRASARTAVYWVALALALVVGAMPLVPPAVEQDPGAASFSTDRALAHVAAVARRPHPVGSAANGIIRNYILSELRDLGLEPEIQTVEASDYFGDSGRPIQMDNVIARVRGTASTGAVAVVGHYDSVPWSPGANDDASAVAVMLESARAILAGEPVRNDVLLVFTDGEEPAPRLGSTAFVDHHPSADDIQFVINLEAAGSAGPSLLLETSGPDRWVIERYIAGVPHPAAFSFLTGISELIGGSNTDFASFRDSGIAGVEFVYAHGSPIYHTPADVIDRVSRRSLQQHGANTLALVRSIGDDDFSATRDSSNAVFFTVGRSLVVRYNAVWAVATSVIAGVLLAAAIWRRRATLRVLRSFAVVLGTVVSVAIIQTLLWILVAGRREMMGIAESYAYLGVLVVLGVVLRSAAHRVLPGRWSAPSPLGVLITWWLISLLLVLAEPAMSYLLGLPVLLGAWSMLVWEADNGHRLTRVMATATACLAVVLAVPAIDILYQFAQPRPGNIDSEVLAAIALPLVYAMLVIEVVASFSPNAILRGEQVASRPT